MPPAATAMQPKLKAPPGACDTHMHIYNRRFPKARTAKIEAPDASVADYLKMRARLGIERTVVVQPSTYGKDNRCTLEAMAAIGPTRRRRGRRDCLRRRARTADQAWHPRHPVFHAGRRAAALGNSRNYGGARRIVRLARAASARRPRSARP